MFATIEDIKSFLKADQSLQTLDPSKYHRTLAPLFGLQTSKQVEVEILEPGSRYGSQSSWHQQKNTPPTPIALLNLEASPTKILFRITPTYPIKVKFDWIADITDNIKRVTVLTYAENLYYSRHTWHNQDHQTFAIEMELEGKKIVVLTPTKVAETIFGMKIVFDNCLYAKFGERLVRLEDWEMAMNHSTCYTSGYRDQKKFDFTFGTFWALHQAGFNFEDSSLDAFLKGVLSSKSYIYPDITISGIKKNYDRCLTFVEAIKNEQPLVYMAFRTIADNSGRGFEGVKGSVIFNDLFGTANSLDEVVAGLKQLYPKFLTSCDGLEHGVYNINKNLDEAVKQLPFWKEKRKAIIKSTSNRAFSKLMEDYEFLKMDEEKYPVTTKAIKDGELPIGAFFRKSEQYFLLNDNWDLWEEMLSKYRKTTIELANEVKGRTTYEKDLMSYFYFVLYALPEYLKKHTAKKWKCSPKLVNSQDELEPPKEEDNGITRQRSALTPIVDNDKNTVEVPYASLAMGGGYGTTYCYSHDYHILTKGFSFNGNVVTKDIEENLNGRDDYGQMFYTLTGSAQGRGYPTFLIIFERRSQKGDTKVHFHRTHPSRSKSGDYNPIHNWVRTTFNWMAGNVNRSLIKAQQGDLFFVEIADTNLEFKTKVTSYDKHCFEQGVEFAEYTKATKSNILGYVRLDDKTWLKHTEHDDVLIPAGTYAIHQCRSWEANPSGVWSLRID